MQGSSVTRYLTETFDGVDTVTGDGVTFFTYDPGHQFPNGNYFATIMTKDNAYDDVSRLDRPGVQRLNIGVSKAIAEALFGPAAAEASARRPAPWGAGQGNGRPSGTPARPIPLMMLAIARGRNARS